MIKSLKVLLVICGIAFLASCHYWIWSGVKETFIKIMLTSLMDGFIIFILLVSNDDGDTDD